MSRDAGREGRVQDLIRSLNSGSASDCKLRAVMVCIRVLSNTSITWESLSVMCSRVMYLFIYYLFLQQHPNRPDWLHVCCIAQRDFVLDYWFVPSDLIFPLPLGSLASLRLKFRAPCLLDRHSHICDKSLGPSHGLNTNPIFWTNWIL